MTGWRGVNYTGEIKDCQALCGGCFGLSGPGSIYWVGTTQQQREESQAECPQMTTTELPERFCTVVALESCVGVVCQTHQVDSTQWRPACEGPSPPKATVHSRINIWKPWVRKDQKLEGWSLGIFKVCCHICRAELSRGPDAPTAFYSGKFSCHSLISQSLDS